MRKVSTEKERASSDVSPESYGASITVRRGGTVAANFGKCRITDKSTDPANDGMM